MRHSGDGEAGNSQPKWKGRVGALRQQLRTPHPRSPCGRGAEHPALRGQGLGVGEQEATGGSWLGRAPGCRLHGHDGAAAPDGGTRGGGPSPSCRARGFPGGGQQELAGAPQRGWIHLQLRSHLSRSKRGETSSNHG